MDKSWATGMTQEAFRHEFKRRNPNADTIPDVVEWLAAPSGDVAPMKLPMAEEINPNLDGRDRVKMILENEAVKAEENGGDAGHQNSVFNCECGMSIKSKIGLWNHQKKCETHLNTRAA